jgi:hypothetical protein
MTVRLLLSHRSDRAAFKIAPRIAFDCQTANDPFTSVRMNTSVMDTLHEADEGGEIALLRIDSSCLACEIESKDSRSTPG